ncbi:unnamed protein product [Blepharisma stoltei]|uniref:Serine aminopeptidase S33 domain-containing protein n=1 Tax=Blepharisma stoltei TaxID=1481888 RepID=A0AAU9IP92_9CILI|nr:unnamed protein product [Blepharisma stoltei]
MQNLSKFIIRPSRNLYSLNRDLGPENFILKGQVFTRRDFDLPNTRGLVLKCSWFLPKFSKNTLPCIVYCHGNCGSRLDSLEIAYRLLESDISLFTFDFAGSGLSEGSYVSLGYYESWDLKSVMDYIKESGLASAIGLWGRSMGATSSILYGSCDPTLAVLILDSPFLSLKQVVDDYLGKYNFIPKKLLGFFWDKIKNHIRKKANFDISEVNPAKFISQCEMPAIFMHGIDDKLVSISHGRMLYELYRGEKYLLELGGGHNSTRAQKVIDRVIEILVQTFSSPQLPQEILEESIKTRRASNIIFFRK